MIILELRARDFMRLRAVHIKPDGSVVKVTGRNGQGKTSVLRSIMAALGGKDEVPDVPIRTTADGAEVLLELGEPGGPPRYLVSRRFTGANSYLTITNADGFTAGRPQELLDGVVGPIALDPLEFIRQDAKTRGETLRRLLNVKTDDLETRYRTAYDERTAITRDGKAAAATLARMPEPPADTPDEEIAPDALREELNVAREKAAKANQQKHEIYAAESCLAGLRTELRERSERLDALLRQVRQAEQAVTETRDEIGRGEALLANLRAAPTIDVPDTDALLARIADVNGINANVRAKADRAKQTKVVEDLRAKYDALEAELKAVAEERRARFKAAPTPVPGLTLGEAGEVLLNDLPLEQASGAEQLRVSVAIAAALKPALRVILVKEGSLLDSDGMTFLGEWAEANGFQIWIERVETDGSGVMIEDGLVAGAPAEDPAPAKPARKRSN